MDFEVSQVPRRLGRQLCNTAVMTLAEWKRLFLFLHDMVGVKVYFEITMLI